MDKWQGYRWVLGAVPVKLSDFIKRGQVRKATKDVALIKSLILMTESDLRFLENTKIDGDSARKVMSNYYDCIRSIIEALALEEGYKVYSHEAFTIFLEEKDENLLAQKFDRFRKIRNGINYYGKLISPDEVQEHKEEIKKMIGQLKQKYLNKI